MLDQFISKFNNFTIHDEKGKSYVLLVQRALYQSLPSDKKRVHPNANTITSNDDFLSFADKLKNKGVKEEVKAIAPPESPKPSVIESPSIESVNVEEVTKQQEAVASTVESEKKVAGTPVKTKPEPSNIHQLI